MAPPESKPGEEEDWSKTATDVYHLDADTFRSFIKKKKHALVMFYAQWCGHCKKMKPEFAAAASAFTDNLKVAFCAIDCGKSQALCTQHKVEGFPTLIYFNYGKDPTPYTRGRTEKDFVRYMNDPAAPLPTQTEMFWDDVPNAEYITHLGDDNFDEFINGHELALVIFYAPWCGHCKAIKPAFAEAALRLAERNIAAFGALDASGDTLKQNEYEVKGFPTIKLFRNGVQYGSDYMGTRSADDLENFVMQVFEKFQEPKVQPPHLGVEDADEPADKPVEPAHPEVKVDKMESKREERPGKDAPDPPEVVDDRKTKDDSFDPKPPSEPTEEKVPSKPTDAHKKEKIVAPPSPEMEKPKPPTVEKVKPKMESKKKEQKDAKIKTPEQRSEL